MTAFRAAFKAYRMHQVLIMPRFARLTIALGLATAVFPVDAEYYFNPRFLSNDLAESVDLSAFTKGREAPPGTYRVDIYLNDEFMTSRDITFIADDNNAELIPCLSTDLLVSLGIKKRYDIFQCQSPKLLEHVTQRPANIIWIKCAVW